MVKAALLVVGLGAVLEGAAAFMAAPQCSALASAQRLTAAPLHMSSSASDVLADLEALDGVMGGEDEDSSSSDMERQPYLNRLAMQAARREWQRDEKDSGSAEVQVAILTERIIYLTKHLQTNPKDFHSRRGLISLVNKRRAQLNYLFEHTPERCLQICAALGIRFRPRAAVQSREQKYASFRNTKSKIGMVRAAALQTRALQQRESEK